MAPEEGAPAEVLDHRRAQRDAEHGATRPDQRPPAQRLDPVLAVEELENDRHRRGARGGALHPVEGPGEEEESHAGRQRCEDCADHGPEQTELVEAAVPEEVADLAEEGRRHAEGQQRSRRHPGQRREVGVEVRLDRRQRHHEDGEGDVERQEPREQRHQRPPLVARAAHGTGGDPAVQQVEPVGLDGAVPQRPHGPATGVVRRIEQRVSRLDRGGLHDRTPYRCPISRLPQRPRSRDHQCGSRPCA